MISICITVKNRSRITVDGHELFLFPNCVKSIVTATTPDINCELVVSDWESDDWPLKEWVHQLAHPVPVTLVTVEGQFSRGKGLNEAAKWAKGDVLLFLDADCLVSETLFTLGVQYVSEGKVYFPVLYSFADPAHNTGWWMHEGYGICMLSKITYQATLGWPEYSSWGKEDDDFYSVLSKIANVIRETVSGFYHQWHPNDIKWKSLYYSDLPPSFVQEQERIKVTAQELGKIIPNHLKVILVDEVYFENDLLSNHDVLPFLEHNNLYWGPPVDDATAIREVERMRKAGASFMVFAWIAFWWLDYYKEFHSYLRSHFRCVLENERLVIFDLRSGR